MNCKNCGCAYHECECQERMAALLHRAEMARIKQGIEDMRQALQREGSEGVTERWPPPLLCPRRMREVGMFRGYRW